MNRGDLARMGPPVTAGRAELVSWLQANTPRFPSWEAAIREIAAMLGSGATPAVDAYVRDMLVEVDGGIRDRTPVDRLADLLLAVVGDDVIARASSIAVPTLLLVCGEPAENRVVRETAWQAIAHASNQIELHVAEGWGHNPILADPEASSRLIADWIRARL